MDDAAGKLANDRVGKPVVCSGGASKFIVPNQLDHRWNHGLALFFNRTAGIPISAFASVFNITMFPLGMGPEAVCGDHGDEHGDLPAAAGHSGTGRRKDQPMGGAAGGRGRRCLIGVGIGIVMRVGPPPAAWDIPALT